MILDSEGQVDDYFNADKNPFQRADSPDDLAGFLSANTHVRTGENN